MEDYNVPYWTNFGPGMQFEGLTVGTDSVEKGVKFTYYR